MKCLAVLLSAGLILVACVRQSTHSDCTQYEPYQAAIPYCCLFKSGYCQRTCYRYETRQRCVSIECQQGYVWQEKPDATWWQDKRQCVPEKSSLEP